MYRKKHKPQYKPQHRPAKTGYKRTKFTYYGKKPTEEDYYWKKKYDELLSDILKPPAPAKRKGQKKRQRRPYV